MRGEAPLWDFPDGTLHRREVAAFELARALGWPRVPPTVLRDGPYGPGSVQLFVSFDPAEHFFTLEVEHADTFRRVAMFDLAANNADRKGGHCLLDADGEIWVIDHGVCFAVEPKLRTVIWTFVDEPLPPTRPPIWRASAPSSTAGGAVADDARRAARARRDRPRSRTGSTGSSRRGASPSPSPASARSHGRRSDASARARCRRRSDRSPSWCRPTAWSPRRGGDPRELVDELARRLGRGVAGGGAPRRHPRPRGATSAAGVRRCARRSTSASWARRSRVRCSRSRARSRTRELWTYGDVAARAGRPGAARAAGSALARSPIELFVPCHRVVPAGSGLGSYGGSEDRRATLLRFEGAI